VSSVPAAPLPASLEDTPFSSPEGRALLSGLDVHTVPAADDCHKIAVYQVSGDVPDEKDLPILLLHGRTWSSIPVYHLFGGRSNTTRNDTPASRSTMEALSERPRFVPYAMDFRGFGGTPCDGTGCVKPSRCVADVESVLSWVAKRHGGRIPALVGWSQGALVAQLVAQHSPDLISKLVLYGSIYDPLVSYPRTPLYVTPTMKTSRVENTIDSAIEDFTVEGSIPPEPAKEFARAALISDPFKAVWESLHEFNNLDPARVNVPTLVLVGEKDPYSSIRAQTALFTNLGRDIDRTWTIIQNADHAVHLLDKGKSQFIKSVCSFLDSD